jgi:hypothetical protein
MLVRGRSHAVMGQPTNDLGSPPSASTSVTELMASSRSSMTTGMHILPTWAISEANSGNRRSAAATGSTQASNNATAGVSLGFATSRSKSVMHLP